MTKSNKKNVAKHSDTRKKKDPWSKLLAYFNWLAWIIVLLVLVTTECAKPQFETFFDRFYGLNLRTNWDLDFLKYLIVVSILGIIMSLLGGILNLARARRRNDFGILHISVMGIVSLIALIWAIYYISYPA